MPIEMAPAMSSAIPPRTTSFDSPREDRPAVKAKGTVRPSERPITLARGQYLEDDKRGIFFIDAHISDYVRVDEGALLLIELPAADAACARVTTALGDERGVDAGGGVLDGPDGGLDGILSWWEGDGGHGSRDSALVIRLFFL